MKKSITIFVHNLFFMGGTTRAVTNTANMLYRQGHNVTILSTFRSRKDPYFPLEENIQVKSIIDYTSENNMRLIDIFFNRLNHFLYPIFKSREIHLAEPGIRQFSRHIEKRMIKEIKQVNTDILICTRASYNLLAAKYAPENVKLIAQEHMVYTMHPKELQQEIQRNYHRFDYVTTLTADDAQDYKQFLTAGQVIPIPNILSDEYLHHSHEQGKNIILAAGRFEEEKGFDLLIEAIHLYAEDLQGWEVHIYGEGQQKELLKGLIHQYNLHHMIKLYPPTENLAEVMNKAKIFVLPSRFEGFGMVIIEAMASGLPVIAFDCPVGPRNIIDETNGILVEAENTQQLGRSLAGLAFDTNARENYKLAGIQTSRQYTAERIYKCWERIL